tara:strand:- start:1891 stop:3180 length:1290 start_codon:yes stop_codon:yes gene_type:complete
MQINQMKKTLIINAFEKISNNELNRIIDLVVSYDFSNISFLNLNAKNINYLKKSDIKTVNINQLDSHYDACIKIGENLQTISLKNTFVQSCYFILIKDLRYRLKIKKIDGSSYTNNIEKTIFGKMSKGLEKNFLFFPRSYFYRMLGQGPVNQMGFRQKDDISIYERRDKNTKLICTFGGSTTWSIDCIFSETWSSTLEKILNEDPQIKKKGLKFLVLNFGQVAMTVMDQMFTYISFADYLNPEIVISHDGGNDAFYSAYTDSYLLKKYYITYPCELEHWGKFVHNSDTETNNTIELPWPFKNVPHEIVKAFIYRKSQFQNFVCNKKSKFIWGQQPMIWNKKILNKNEVEIIKNTNNFSDDDSKINKHMPKLMEMLKENSKIHAKIFVDCAKFFEKLNIEDQLFTDRIHLNHKGDFEIAKIYYNKIKEII